MPRTFEFFGCLQKHHTVHWRARAQLRHLHAQCTLSQASAGTHWQQLRPSSLAVSGSQAADWALLREGILT